MPALNFAPQFAEAVENGTKRMTIRTIRKRPIEAGQNLQLYTGLRTKRARLLRRAVCREVRPVLIGDYEVEIGGVRQTLSLIECLAFNDGFHTVSEFLGWFRDHYGLPFLGVQILW